MTRATALLFGLSLTSFIAGCSDTPPGDSPTPGTSPTPGAESPGVTGTPTPQATATPLATPTLTPAPTPTATPTPTPEPTPTPTAPPELSTLIQTQSGPVQGFEEPNGTIAWLGIPFAAPPIGALRWLAPQDPTPWEAPFEASTLGPKCPQLESVDTDGDGTNENVLVGNESCLQLNVWRPKTQAQRLRPVMFWIHGGANTQGSASDKTYYGATLAAQADALLVTIDYRLNMLGYLRHEALATGDPAGDSGSFGTLDILKALNWVKANAEAFGGDPNRVMVFGESAGGVNTWAMMQSPLAAGNFHSAIVESGCPNTSSPDEARSASQSYLEQYVVADGLTTAENAAGYLANQGNAWIREYLYGKSLEQLFSIFMEDGFGLSEFDPVRDGYVLRAGGYDDLFAGNFNRVPLIVGSNRDEMKLFYASLYSMNEVQYNALMKTLFGDRVDEVEAMYPRNEYDPATAYNQFTDILDASLELTCNPYPAWVAAAYTPTWLYHFEFDDLVQPYDYILGAAHGLELPFVFGDVDIEGFYPTNGLDDREELSAQVMHYWSCMAYTGNPNCESSDGVPVLDWPTLGTTADQYHQLVLDTPLQLGFMPDIEVERINFWLDYSESTSPRMPLP